MKFQMFSRSEEVIASDPELCIPFLLACDNTIHTPHVHYFYCSGLFAPNCAVTVTSTNMSGKYKIVTIVEDDQELNWLPKFFLWSCIIVFVLSGVKWIMRKWLIP